MNCSESQSRFTISVGRKDRRVRDVEREDSLGENAKAQKRLKRAGRKTGRVFSWLNRCVDCQRRWEGVMAEDVGEKERKEAAWEDMQANTVGGSR